MRFMEIANPEDQLALWRLISDNVWGAFAQQPPQPQPRATTAPVRATLATPDTPASNVSADTRPPPFAQVFITITKQDGFGCKVFGQQSTEVSKDLYFLTVRDFRVHAVFPTGKA